MMHVPAMRSPDVSGVLGHIEVTRTRLKNLWNMSERGDST